MELNNLPAKLTLPTYSAAFLLISLMLIFLFDLHISCVAFYSNKLLKMFSALNLLGLLFIYLFFQEKERLKV